MSYIEDMSNTHRTKPAARKTNIDHNSRTATVTVTNPDGSTIATTTGKRAYKFAACIITTDTDGNHRIATWENGPKVDLIDLHNQATRRNGTAVIIY